MKDLAPNPIVLLEDGSSIPEHQQRVVGRLGNTIELARNESYLKAVKVLDTDGTVFTLNPSLFMTGDEEIDRVMRPFMIASIQQYMPKTLSVIEKQISVFTSTYRNKQDINKAVQDTVLVAHEKGDNDISSIRRLLKWFIAYEVEGLDLDLCADIQSLVFGGNKNSYLALYSLDAENGPFTREELRILQAAALDPNIHIENRVVLKLCLEFGLRPIQIALLKQSDFIVDEDLELAYLNIPRVKQNNQYRRTHFTKRLVSSELAGMLSVLIAIHRTVYEQFEIEDAPLIMRRHLYFSQTYENNPYVLSEYISHETKLISNSHPYLEDFKESDWEDLTHHVRSAQIDYRLDKISELLPNSPRTGLPFKMNAYRFRYTLGTNAVTQGMTEIEVAELLDHSASGSVKHYFHYTHEMFEVLEDATLDRVENKFFTAAWRKQELVGNIYGEDVVSPSTAISIGKCQKNAPCVLEPAVACYQCDKFCPNKNVEGHHQQLKSLQSRAEKAKLVSNKEVAHQFDEAIAGCEAAIQYAGGQDVIAIQHESANDVGKLNVKAD